MPPLAVPAPPAAPSAPPRHAKPIAESDVWLHFVEASGEAGARWLAEYRRPECARLESLSQQALVALRQEQTARGRELLHQLAAGLETLGPVPGSVRQVLRRWYHGVLAYHEYAVGDFAAADAELLAAHEAVCAAIGEHEFLILLAAHCQEFRLHRARTARGRRRWQEVAGLVDDARRMLEGSLPLCELGSGRLLHFRDIRDFYRALPSPDPAILASPLFDDERSRRSLDNFVQTLYVLPGFVLAD